MEFFNDFGGDTSKPSLFELVAQEQLKDLLQPALKYVLATFAQSYPRYLLRIVNRHEEFYAILMYFIEKHYLRTHNASFAEHFYGLKRRRRPWIELERARLAVGGIPEGEKLRKREINQSLLILIGLPYLRAKAHDYYEQLGGGVVPDLLEDGGSRQAHAVSDQSWRSHLRRWFKQYYPWLNASLELWLLTCNVMYLFDRTPNYRPWLTWIGVDLRRLGVEDFRHASVTSRSKGTSFPPRGVLAGLQRLLLKSPRILFDSLKLLLPTAIFFVKFLEWWYSPASPARALTTSPLGPAVPPPRMLLPDPEGIPFDPAKYGECPICHKPFKNPTALPSGYVFCYRCVYDQVEGHGRCPVTLHPVSMWQIRKVLV